MIIFRADKDALFRELILLGCIDVSAPDKLLEGAELNALVDIETIELEQYRANREKLAAHGTDYTLLITGWLPSKSEPKLLDVLSKYVCAWDIQNPSPDEYNDIPVKLKWPKIFGIFYRESGKPFSPLAAVHGAEIADQERHDYL